MLIARGAAFEAQSLRPARPRQNEKTGTPRGIPVDEQCDALLRNSLLLDTSLLTSELTEVVDTRATHDTHLVHLDLVDVGRVEGEDTLDTRSLLPSTIR